MSKNKDPNSLVNIQHDYILNKIKSVQQPGQLYNLVIDDKMETILYNVIKKEQLLRIVASIEKIDAKRRQGTFMTAIYLIDVDIYNLNCIIGDVQTKKYKNGIALFSTFKTHKTQVFWDSTFWTNQVRHYFNDKIEFFNASYFPTETRAFLVDNKTPNSMPIYYNPNCREFVQPQIDLVANALLDLVVSMEEYPLIRFYHPLEGSHEAKRLPELIAAAFQDLLDEYCRQNENYPPPSVSSKPRSILLITDRAMDLYAPLLHEFSYQAMAMDIVESLERTGKYKYSSENEKGEITEVESPLENEDDEDWVNLRHLHIIESSELIFNKITELIKNNPLMIDRSKATTSSDLMYIVAHLKGFDEERKQLTLHKSLIDECLDINASRKLAEFAADFEQTCCAEGVSFEGERNKHLHDDLIILLARDDLHINDKMRLVLIYAFYRGGLVRSDFEKMIRFIGVNDRYITGLVEKCFYNVDKLGFQIFKKDTKEKPFHKEMYHVINNEGTYNTSRFTPGIKRIMQNAGKYSLDREWFPYFRDQPLDEDLPTNNARMSSPGASGKDLQSSGSLRNTRIKAAWASSSRSTMTMSSVTKNKQRIFCFVAGGMTYSEMRTIYELTSTMNKEFYIGSESILKPRDFLIGLQSIDESKNPANLDLNITKVLSKPTDPPLHVFQDGIPKPNVNPASTMHTQQNQFQQQVQQQQQLYSSTHEANGSGGVPSHYQKRQTHGYHDSVSSKSSKSSSDTKEKKKSKLKRLFK
ncbi:SEC1 Protein transport protein SEC1 [Candida maltosa Xu316]|uniref:Vesicular transport Sm-like protein, putative n=1 Tax=Candida maltosa (strain Xu316) TaxID=1245528 RepID=M3HJU4_CANMX|nr:Vesicular transport Sm-like protein, putative [Candida maltosa Xu316]